MGTLIQSTLQYINLHSWACVAPAALQLSNKNRNHTVLEINLQRKSSQTTRRPFGSPQSIQAAKHWVLLWACEGRFLLLCALKEAKGKLFGTISSPSHFIFTNVAFTWFSNAPHVSFFTFASWPKTAENRVWVRPFVMLSNTVLLRVFLHEWVFSLWVISKSVRFLTVSTQVALKLKFLIRNVWKKTKTIT